MAELVEDYEQRVRQFRAMVDAVARAGRPWWGLYMECIRKLGTSEDLVDGDVERDPSAPGMAERLKNHFRGRSVGEGDVGGEDEVRCRTVW